MSGRSRERNERAGVVGSAHPLLAEVQRHLDDDIDLAALAERFGYSPFHFHRVFTKGVGETPRAHIARLRLEKALLLVVVTNATVLDIALTVGFKSHETFTRAFKRRFDVTPRRLRGDARKTDRRAPEGRAPASDEGFTLSGVRFVSLPPMHLLAVRRIGPYSEQHAPPYTDGDPYWPGLVAWAEARGLGYSRLSYGFYLDMPGITPDESQRSDLCIQIDRETAGDGRYFYAPFAGGEFGVIEHRGPYPTLPLAYRALVDTILDVPDRYVLTGAPPFEVHREIRVGGDPNANLTEVYFPVSRVR